MIAYSHKTKQYLLLALKVFILGITFGYIYFKITHNETLDLKEFSSEVFSKNNNSIVSILIFFLLAFANWFFEILKWKTVASVVQKLSFLTAMKQSLYSLTVSLATPNRIGDYGAKAYFFELEKRKQILLLNFFSNSVQMGVTILFGILGLTYIIQKFGLSISFSKLAIGVFSLILIVILGFVFKEQQLIVKGLSISKVLNHIKNLSFLVKIKAVTYSFIRYLIFSYLFFYLLLFFGATISLYEAFPIIFAMYLLVSLVPTIFIFDVIVRGGTAVWLFSIIGVSELTVLSTVLAMWMLNFVFPSILGGYYMFTYKPRKS